MTREFIESATPFIFGPAGRVGGGGSLVVEMHRGPRLRRLLLSGGLRRGFHDHRAYQGLIHFLILLRGGGPGEVALHRLPH